MGIDSLRNCGNLCRICAWILHAHTPCKGVHTCKDMYWKINSGREREWQNALKNFDAHPFRRLPTTDLSPGLSVIFDWVSWHVVVRCQIKPKKKNILTQWLPKLITFPFCIFEGESSKSDVSWMKLGRAKTTTTEREVIGTKTPPKLPASPCFLLMASLRS